MSHSSPLESLNDRSLLAQFGDLVRQDHEGNANLLRHIDAIERRKLWAKLGHPSMFDFLVTRHHMSESTAGKRIGAARTARRFPVLFGMVARGELHLSGIHRLKAHLTPENHQRVLEQAKHKTIRQIDVLVAQLAPQPDCPSRLCALPNRTATVTDPALAAPVASPVVAPEVATRSTSSPAPITSAPATAPPTPAPLPLPPRRDPDPAPLSPGRWKLQVTLSQSGHDKLEQLQALLAHQIRDRDPAAIIERALDALLTHVQKRKLGMTDKPRASKPASKPTRTQGRTRHVAAAERREVWPRDDGRCGFVGEDGHRCKETYGLQFAHIEPWAKGGPNAADNFGLRCAAHNALEADRDYGTSFMASKRKQKARPTRPLHVREALSRYVTRNEAAPPFPSASVLSHKPLASSV